MIGAININRGQHLIRPPFPHVIDSSMLSAFRACPRKFELEYLHHWKPKAPSVHLVAGGAFARGLEVARLAFYADGKPPEEAVALGFEACLKAYGNFDCPADSAKSAERTATALVYYLDQYRLGEDTAIPIKLPDGRLGIEFSFAEPIDLHHPETGDPLVYCGRFDMLVNFAGGQFGEDDKTTSSLGASWSDQWHMRAQFTAYCWGARQAGIPIDGFLVRGCGILKTKFDTQQCVTYRPAWMVDRWYEQTLRDVRRMLEMWESGAFDYNLDASCESYGGCMFKPVCTSQDPAPWLEQGFEKRRWDPLLRVETGV